MRAVLIQEYHGDTMIMLAQDSGQNPATQHRQLFRSSNNSVPECLDVETLILVVT